MYEKIAEFIAEILISGRVPEGESEGFSRRTKTAYFVFACDNDVKVLITEIDQKAVELLTADKRKGNIGALVSTDIGVAGDEI